jgi:hypothetical protein
MYTISAFPIVKLDSCHVGKIEQDSQAARGGVLVRPIRRQLVLCVELDGSVLISCVKVA